jgi:hypothetical protein
MTIKEAKEILRNHGFNVRPGRHTNGGMLNELSRYNRQSFRVTYGDPMGGHRRTSIVTAYSWKEAVDAAEEGKPSDLSSILAIEATF